MQIIEARLNKGMSQKRLALEAGIHPKTVRKIERGEKVQLENLRQVCRVLDIDPASVGEREREADDEFGHPEIYERTASSTAIVSDWVMALERMEASRYAAEFTAVDRKSVMLDRLGLVSIAGFAVALPSGFWIRDMLGSEVLSSVLLLGFAGAIIFWFFATYLLGRTSSEILSMMWTFDHSDFRKEASVILDAVARGDCLPSERQRHMLTAFSSKKAVRLSEGMQKALHQPFMP